MFRLLITFLFAFTGIAAAGVSHAERIKDIGTFAGLRANQLTGYGIVVGLAGTGDDSLDYATLGMKGVASRFGLQLPAGVNPALKNAASVMLTAELPPFAKPCQRLDFTTSPLSNTYILSACIIVDRRWAINMVI